MAVESREIHPVSVEDLLDVFTSREAELEQGLENWMKNAQVSGSERDAMRGSLRRLCAMEK